MSREIDVYAESVVAEEQGAMKCLLLLNARR